MKKLAVIIGLGFALVSFGVFYFIYNYQGPLIKVMNPTYFESSTKLGQALAERFYVDIKDMPEGPVILGISDQIETDEAVWSGFIEKLETLAVHFTSQIRFYNREELRVFLESPDSRQGRPLIFVPTSIDTRTLVQHKYLSFWVTEYSHLGGANSQTEKDCDYKSQAVSFACLKDRVEHSYYRKKLKEDRYSAMMQQLFENTYVLFIHEPKS